MAHVILVDELEAALAAELRAAGAQVITSAELLATYPLSSWDDPAADELGHIPYTEELFAALGAMIARRVRAFVAAPYKVLALDADNTIWSGVVGEDGADGVVIDEGREALQRFALAQRDAGMLLCLCSKNVEEDVAEVFRRRAMPLRQEHLVTSRVNWAPKSENLRSIAAELGLGLEAFIFLDDSLVECAEVRANCPEVLTVQLPAGSAEAAALLRHVWAFDRWKVTDEDKRRLVRRLGLGHQLGHFGLQLRLDLARMLVRQRAMTTGVGVDLRAIQRHRAHLQDAHFPRHAQNLDEQSLDLLEKALAKRGDRVVIGMVVGGDVAERHRIVGRPLQLAAREDAGGVPIDDQAE